ncbi:MAG: tetratricopeptide repeat protein [Zetaproteobacteria bacterium]|nr:tetratricopeptide repeat protein [Zetaproteobacteria bacterium]
MAKISKILIVDEVESNLLFWEMLIQDLGKAIQVNTATTGAHADSLAKAENPHLIICAWEMETTPGTIIIQKLRLKKPHLPCLIFSKRMSEEDIRLTQELGFDDILGMPFDKEKAFNQLQELIRREESITAEEKKIRKIEQLVTEGKFNEALKWFDGPLTKKNSPVRFRAQVHLAEIWLGIKNLEKAEHTIAILIEEKPDDTNILRLKARLCSMKGAHEEAIALLEKMVENSPQNLTSLVSLGSAYVEADEHDKAKDVFKRVEELDEDNEQAKEEQGKLAFKEGNLSLAAEFLAQTQNGDVLASHFNNIAIAKAATASFDEAIQTYENAISLLADKAKTHLLVYNLGLAWKRKGDLPKSFELLCESYISEPKFEKAYAALARVARDIKSEGNTPDTSLVEKVKSARAEYKDTAENS